jgi:hypothetical protein
MIGRRIGAALLIVVAIYNVLQIGSIKLWTGRGFRSVENPANGMHVVALVFSAMLAAIVFKRDKLDGRLTLKYLPLTLALVAGLAFGQRMIFSTTWHTDPIDAARAFDKGKRLDMTSTGTILFAPGWDGKTHLAWITPGLVRALTARHVSVYAQQDFDCTVPGLAPAAVLLGLAALGAARPGLRRHDLAPWILGIHLYVAVWWSMSQTGFITSGVELHPGPVAFGLFILILGIGFQTAVRRHIDRTWDTPAVEGWIAAAHLPFLVAIAGIYFTAHRTPGNPAFLWLMIYLVASAIAWQASRRPA